MRLVALLVLSAVLFAGCGGDKPDPKSKSSSESTSAASEIGVAEACPRLEAIVGIDYLDSDLADWQQAAEELASLERDGDSGVDALVAKIRPAVEANLSYAEAGRPAGQGGEAFSAQSDALEVVSASC